MKLMQDNIYETIYSIVSDKLLLEATAQEIHQKDEVFGKSMFENKINNKKLLNEKLGVSSEVQNTAKKVADEIWKKRNESHSAFMLQDIDFIGKLWVNSYLTKDKNEVNADINHIRFPGVYNDRLYDFTYKEDTSIEDYINRGMSAISLNVYFFSNDYNSLLDIITHEVNHIYDFYIKGKNNKEVPFTRLDVNARNAEDSGNPEARKVGALIYYGRDSEIQSYTQQSFSEMKNGTPYDKTVLYNIYNDLIYMQSKINAYDDDDWEQVMYYVFPNTKIKGHADLDYLYNNDFSEKDTPSIEYIKKYVNNLLDKTLKKYIKNIGRLRANFNTNEEIKGKKVIIKEEQVKLLRQIINEDNREVTYYEFLSQLKAFLRDLLSNPVTSQLDDFWKLRGFSKSKLILYLIKKGIIEKDEKLNEDNPEEVKMDISYKIPKKNFQRSVKRMYQRFFEKNDIEQLEEDGATGAGATSVGGAGLDGSNTLLTPVFPVQSRPIYKPKLQEGLSSILYHFTSPDRLVEILQSNEMVSHHHAEKPYDNFYRFSFTRTKKGDTGYQMNNYGARITFDGNLLSTKYKGVPYDYYSSTGNEGWGSKENRRKEDLKSIPSDLVNRGESVLARYTEMEDMLLSPKDTIDNISKYIIRIDVLLENENNFKKYIKDYKPRYKTAIKELTNTNFYKSGKMYFYDNMKDFNFQTNNIVINSQLILYLNEALSPIAGLPGISIDDVKLIQNSPLTMGIIGNTKSEKRDNLINKINDNIMNNKGLKFATSSSQPKCNLARFPQLWDEYKSNLNFYNSKEEAINNRKNNDYVLYIANSDDSYNNIEHFSI